MPGCSGQGQGWMRPPGRRSRALAARAPPRGFGGGAGAVSGAAKHGGPTGAPGAHRGGRRGRRGGGGSRGVRRLVFGAGLVARQMGRPPPRAPRRRWLASCGDAGVGCRAARSRGGQRPGADPGAAGRGSRWWTGPGPRRAGRRGGARGGRWRHRRTREGGAASAAHPGTAGGGRPLG